MQELVNDDDLGGPAILEKAIDVVSSPPGDEMQLLFVTRQHP